ncbi:sulfotransferase [Pseudoalteromonas espejiana]
MRDNSLSAYFQHLGPSLNYAINLSDTLHYYRAQQKVKSHWLKKYTDDIFTLNYDELVSKPEKVLIPLFDFLGIEYKGENSSFHKKKIL